MSYNALKILIVVTLLTLALLAIVILDPGALDALAVGLTRSPGALMAITVFLILFIATVVYLQRGLQPQQSRQPTPLDAEALRTLSGQVSEIANAISGFSMRLFRMEENFEEASRARLEIPEAERTALIARLRQTVEQAATDEILENMRASVETNQAQLELAEIIERQLQSTVGRLRSEIYTLTRRGTVNLALGVAMAGTGMGVLYSYVGGMSPSGGNFPLFAETFIPRMSLVIVIEVLGYFFLRLYSNGIIEIKYFQNEITNVESRFLALRAARHSGSARSIGNVIFRLARTERNYVLRKGQTTVEVERSKAERETTAYLAKVVAKLLSRKA